MPTHSRHIASILLCVLLTSLHAGTIHVSPTGNDTHDGSAAAPLATLQKAVELATAATDATTIVVHAGAYYGPVRLQRTEGENLPRLTITAAPAEGGGFAEAVLDGSMTVDDAKPLEEHPGVYEIHLPNFTSASIKPEMWEIDTRTRYTYAADLRGVAARPATFFHDANRHRVVFHTSDGLPPQQHQIGLQRTGVHTATRLWIQRPNVTVRGLTLRHGVDIAIDADDVVVEDCRTFNAIRAVIVHPNANRARVLRHHAADIATGVLSHGNGTVVEDSTFLRPLDDFTVALNTQDQSGVQFYAPAIGGTARRNLVVGFHLGLFMKGVTGNFLIEDNTAVGPGSDVINSYGVFHVSGWRDGDVCRNNVIVGYHMPAPSAQTFAAGFVHEGNCYWDGSDMAGLQSLLDRYRESGTGKGDRIADPGPLKVAVPHASPKGEVAAAPVAVDENPPALVAAPRVRANAHGAALQFTTASPSVANMLWGWDSACGNRIESPRYIERRYDSNVGNEFTLVDEPLSRTRHFATIVPEGDAAADRVLFYRLELIDASGRKTLTETSKVVLRGEPRVWRVAPSGSDDDGSGTLRTIQAAVDRALPGDRIVLADGLYADRVVIRHGGVAGAPLIIEAEHEHQALIDTDQDPAIHSVFQLESARHVILRGLEFRWFFSYAIYAHQTANIDIERCKFWNMHFVKGRRSGVGVFATRGSDLRIDHCLFFNMNAAFDILRTQRFTVTHNTAIRLTHRVALFANSGPGVVRNNSFTFTGNYHYHLSLSREQLEQFDSDYNNLAQYVHMSYAEKDHPTAQELAEMLDPSGEDVSVYPTGNKGIASISGRPSETVPFFSRWQRKYSKDAHSVFAHPRYVDPRNHDFRVPADSPNVGAGEGGRTIGACDGAAP